MCRWERRTPGAFRPTFASDISIAGAVHGDGAAEIVRGTPKKSGIDNARSIGGQFGNEDIIVTVVSTLDGVDMREIRRFCAACYIGIAAGVHRDTACTIIAYTAEIGRLNKGVA